MTETNWKAVGRAFECIGMKLRTECELMEDACKENDEFEIVYYHYTLLLNMMNLQRSAIDTLFDAIKEKEWWSDGD